jgi:excisionase family DNA binding protein
MKNQTDVIEPQFFTKAQAQKYTSLSARTIDYARERQQLPFYRHGKRILLKRADVDRWMEQHRATTQADVQTI